MNALSRWADEYAFHAADPRRRVSAEVDFGATWRVEGCNDAWRLSWIRDTAELYVCRADGHDGSCTDVAVIAQIAREAAVDAMLEGWQEQRTSAERLSWLASRVRPLAVA